MVQVASPAAVVQASLSARLIVGVGRKNTTWPSSFRLVDSIDPSFLEIAPNKQQKTHAKPFPRSLRLA